MSVPGGFWKSERESFIRRNGSEASSIWCGVLCIARKPERRASGTAHRGEASCLSLCCTDGRQTFRGARSLESLILGESSLSRGHFATSKRGVSPQSGQEASQIYSYHEQRRTRPRW